MSKGVKVSNYFLGKKVLVAGGTGLIGRPLVEMLFQQGAEVRISSMDNKNRAHPEAEYLQYDLTDYATCLKVCDGIDVVFNLLCTKGSPATSKTNGVDFLEPMVLYNTNLMRAARVSKVKSFMFTSSVCVYPPAEIFYENDPLISPPSPNDPWAGLAKRVGEKQALANAIQYGWNTIAIVRPSNVYGPYDNFNQFNAMVVPSLIKRVAEAEDKIVVWGDGTAERDFIYCDDVARGMLLAVEKQLSPDYPINLGVGYGISIKELIETIVRVSGKKLEIIFDTSKPSGDRKRILDTTRAKGVGFLPQISLEEGLRKTYYWYLENKELAENRYDVFNRPKN